MSCTDDIPGVEREIVLPAPPGEVWDDLPGLLGESVELELEVGGRLHASGPEGDRTGVVEAVDAPWRLAFWWVPVDGDAAPSYVEIELAAVELAGEQGTGATPAGGVGTLLRVRESRFEAAVVVDGLSRGPLARARA